MKHAEEYCPVSDSFRRSPRAEPRSAEPETRALDSAEIARLIAQARARPAPNPPSASPASERPRPTASRPTGMLASHACELPRVLRSLPASMPAPPLQRTPARVPCAVECDVELSDLHARPPKPWSPARIGRAPVDQAQPRPRALDSAPHTPARLPPPPTTGSKCWRAPADPPARELTVRLSASEANHLPYRGRDLRARATATPSSKTAVAARSGVRAPLAIGALVVCALGALWLTPRGVALRVSDLVRRALPQDMATLPTAAAQAPASAPAAPATPAADTPAPALPATALPAAAPSSLTPSPIAAATPASIAAAQPRATKAPSRPPPSERVAPRTGSDPATSRASAVANAIEQLALGHQREALAAYRRLAEAQPERPAYAAIVRILQHELRTRCTRAADSLGSPCEASP
jgi:hypothetical protein